MIIKIDKQEAGKILEKHIERMIPNTLVVATSNYDGFELEVSEKAESKP